MSRIDRFAENFVHRYIDGFIFLVFVGAGAIPAFIRRYPDLVIHRMLLDLIVGKKPKYSFDRLAALGNHCSSMEQRAERAERELTKLKLLNYFAMPETLQGKYQSFTEASIGKLLSAGCSGPWTDVDKGVGSYAAQLYTALKAT